MSLSKVQALLNAAQGPVRIDRRLSAAYHHEYNGTRWLDGATAMSIAGNKAVVASMFWNAIAILDISDPRAPSLKGVVANEALGGPRGIWTDGDTAIVTGFESGTVTVIDIRRSNPRITGRSLMHHSRARTAWWYWERKHS